MYPAGEAGVSCRILELPGGERVRCAATGPLTGVPIVLVHGWGASLYGYRQVLPVLAADGCRAVAVDLHGYPIGSPPAPKGSRRHTTGAMTERLAAILDALGLERPILVGHSMAGRLVLDYVFENPERVRGAAVLAPIGIGFLRPGVRSAARPILATARRVGPAIVRRSVIRGIVGAVTGRLRRATDRDIDEYWAPTQFQSYLTTVHELLRDFDWRALPPDRLAKIPVPVSILLGELDPIICAPRPSLLVFGMAPHRVRVVAGCGHIIADEAPAVVVDALRELVAVSA